ncbi:hypothetical protein RR46_04291 [Papilio xuthus]|uniref:Uncharacterized protein n=1 Tax=Papilio xuthus TaxID=66420 RepID=A0A194QE29_PAPXU|nr:hypothetical protein RR46_04291 [Papilio xuthus]
MHNKYLDTDVIDFARDVQGVWRGGKGGEVVVNAEHACPLAQLIRDSRRGKAGAAARAAHPNPHESRPTAADQRGKVDDIISRVHTNMTSR